jgi:Tfp pilus assembly protein PilV
MTRGLGRGTRPADGGFTLIEIVVALLVLELAVLGSVGMVVLASSALARAERLERAVALAEGVLDSLAVVADPVGGAASYGAGQVVWAVEEDGRVMVVGHGTTGDTILVVHSILPPARP